MQDRLPDLRALALQQRSGSAASLPPAGASAVLEPARAGGDAHWFDVEAQLGIRARGGEDAAAAAAGAGGASPFMQAFLEELEVLKRDLGQISDSVARMKKLKRRALEAIDPDVEKGISAELQGVLTETNGVVLRVKQKLTALRDENKAFSAKNVGTGEARMRENLTAVVLRRFKEIIKGYQSAQLDYKKDVRDKLARQVRIVFTEASEEEVTRMVHNGDAAATAAAIQLRVTGQSHESLHAALAGLQDKYRDIRRLEQNVSELHQLFVDLATLVDAQGELLDQIEFSVNSAKDYTEKAEKELIITRKNQQLAKKRMCWLAICLVIVTILISLPILVVISR